MARPGQHVGVVIGNIFGQPLCPTHGKLISITSDPEKVTCKVCLEIMQR